MLLLSLGKGVLGREQGLYWLVKVSLWGGGGNGGSRDPVVVKASL